MVKKYEDHKIIRDYTHIDREYNQEKWPTVLHRIEQLVAQGELNLTRVLTQIEDFRRDSLPWACDWLSPHVVHAFNSKATIPFFAAFEGYYHLIAAEIVRNCTADTSAIIELGSGTGHNLFRAWLRGLRSDIKLYALELTEAGRACTKALASLEPSIQICVRPFDFYQEDFSSVRECAGHWLVVTCQSIEQIPQVSQSMFTNLISAAPNLTVLHFEPVGWQVDPDSMLHLDGHREYAITNDYNQNLWQILQSLESHGRIAIDSVHKNFFGVVARNPITNILWHKIR